jgi:recombination protein RecR
MQKRVTGPEIERLIQLLARVPGLGPRSARRAALHLIKKKDQLMGPLALAMNEAFDKVRICSTCGNADTSDPCTVCTDPSTRPERDHRRRGRRRSMGARTRCGDERRLSCAWRHPVAARWRRSRTILSIARLVDRVARGGVREILIAVNATVEGQTTAHYITEQLSGFDSRSPVWPMACRSVASSIISTRARWPQPFAPEPPFRGVPCRSS